MKKKCVFLFFAVFFSLSCMRTQEEPVVQDIKPDPVEEVAAAPPQKAPESPLSGVNVIGIEEAEKMLKEGIPFIDNRPENLFKAGHLEGAVNLPFYVKGHPTNEMTKENLLEAIGDSDKVVFYCTGRFRGLNAFKKAQEWEIDKEMYWYKGGFTEWRAQNKPIVQ